MVTVDIFLHAGPWIIVTQDCPRNIAPFERATFMFFSMVKNVIVFYEQSQVSSITSQWSHLSSTLANIIQKRQIIVYVSYWLHYSLNISHSREAVFHWWGEGHQKSFKSGLYTCRTHIWLIFQIKKGADGPGVYKVRFCWQFLHCFLADIEV